VAAFVAACVDNPATRNKTIQLGGPEPLSPLEVVRIFEDVTGRKFAVEHVREEDLSAQKAAAADSLSQSFTALMLIYARGDSIDVTECQSLFPAIAGGLASVRDYATRSSAGAAPA